MGRNGEEIKCTNHESLDCEAVQGTDFPHLCPYCAYDEGMNDLKNAAYCIRKTGDKKLFNAIRRVLKDSGYLDEEKASHTTLMNHVVENYNTAVVGERGPHWRHEHIENLKDECDKYLKSIEENWPNFFGNRPRRPFTKDEKKAAVKLALKEIEI